MRLLRGLVMGCMLVGAADTEWDVRKQTEAALRNPAGYEKETTW